MQSFEGGCSPIQFSPDGKILVSGVIRLWNLETKELWKTIETNSFISSVAFSRDRQWLLTAASFRYEDNLVCLWDINSSQSLQVLIQSYSRTDVYSVHSAIFNANGDKLYIETSNGIQCWQKSRY